MTQAIHFMDKNENTGTTSGTAKHHLLSGDYAKNKKKVIKNPKRNGDSSNTHALLGRQSTIDNEDDRDDGEAMRVAVAAAVASGQKSSASFEATGLSLLAKNESGSGADPVIKTVKQ